MHYNNCVKHIQKIEPMEKSIKTILLDIDRGKYSKLELQNLLQFIALDLGSRTTSNCARENNKSFNGVKNFTPHIKIDGVKFHSNDLTSSNLPF